MVFYKTLPVVAALVAGTFAASTVVAGGTAAAQPPLHRVQYTVGASQDIANAEIYWRQVDPPDWGAYSHNPYEFTPNVEANLGPNQAWVHETWLGRSQSVGHGAWSACPHSPHRRWPNPASSVN
uniref:Secreted protein n=1 Tax=Mycolicibacterium vanbaalenii (strain DSM 7251 / JCM 13017 / BCRC 16820 / KCTC 9966 / NRRL B-24157 / PYR-1) TaxID=350058 RepID=Q5J6J7_MYCVP|nr:hypothetical protein [Mycolicibacterium vanbaalenii PYR-1]